MEFASHSFYLTYFQMELYDRIKSSTGATTPVYGYIYLAANSVLLAGENQIQNIDLMTLCV